MYYRPRRRSRRMNTRLSLLLTMGVWMFAAGPIGRIPLSIQHERFLSLLSEFQSSSNTESQSAKEAVYSPPPRKTNSEKQPPSDYEMKKTKAKNKREKETAQLMTQSSSPSSSIYASSHRWYPDCRNSQAHWHAGIHG